MSIGKDFCFAAFLHYLESQNILFMQTLRSKKGAVVVTQLAERSLTIPEVHVQMKSSATFIEHVFNTVYCLLKRRK